MDGTLAPTSVFASSAAAAEHLDGVASRMLGGMAAMFTAVGAFVRRRRRHLRPTHEQLRLEHDNRRMAAHLRAASQGGAAAARLL